MTTSRTIALSDVRLDSGIQVRVSIDESVVAEYAELMSEGAVFPPIVVFHDGTTYHLADGFHRFLAARRIGREEFVADVHTGTPTDALWFALGANRTNGVRLTDADKRSAIRKAVSAFPDRSSTQLARQIGCSATYVQRVRGAEVPTGANPVTRVVGSDGVSYPASQSARQAARAEAERLLREGKSVAQVREATGIGRDAAQRLRRTVRPPDMSRGAVQQRQERMRELADAGHSSRQIADEVGLSVEACRRQLKKLGVIVHADAVMRGTRRLNPNRIISTIVADAVNLLEGVAFVDFAHLERGQIPEWLASLKKSRDNLTAFIRRLGQQQ
jgi:ParB-like chromosome segregation protein Spo0J